VQFPYRPAQGSHTATFQPLSGHLAARRRLIVKNPSAMADRDR
jgi:hypothetical protein